VSIARAALTAVLSACALGAAAAQPSAPPLPPLAHSALLAIDAAPSAAGLTLRIRPAAEQRPIAVNDVVVTIDGSSQPASARTDGSWFVQRPAGTLDVGKTIDVAVGHDGIHEVLRGRLAPSGGAAMPGRSGVSRLVSGSHKQLYWWILNIAVVLLAAIAISRRMS
jgi:hypothetical protein